MRALLTVLFVATACMGFSADLTGKWKAKTMGAGGTISFNKDKSYRLELDFKDQRLVQIGKYSLKGNVLTLTPKKRLEGAEMKPLPEDTPPMTLDLTWNGDKSVSAVATRPGRKITKMELWRE